MGIEGVEPSTPRASVVCSPAELYPQKHNDKRFLKVVKRPEAKEIQAVKVNHNIFKRQKSLGFMKEIYGLRRTDFAFRKGLIEYVDRTAHIDKEPESEKIGIRYVFLAIYNVTLVTTPLIAAAIGIEKLLK